MARLLRLTGLTPAEIRQLMDDFGLRGNGSHIGFNFANPDTFEAQLDTAEILGLPYLGTASIPTNSRYKSDWQTACCPMATASSGPTPTRGS